MISVRQDHAAAGSAVATRDVGNLYRLAFFLAAILAGLLQAWAHGHEMNPDGISYIELGWAATHSGLHALVNGYWSPLYPFLLSVFFRIFHPSPANEFVAVHFFNFVLFLLSAAAFDFFLSEILRAQRAAAEGGSSGAPISASTIRLAGYVLFLWSAQFWLGTATVSPDLLVSAAAFCATGLLLRIRQSSGILHFALLGAVVGLGYLAKSAMFPLAFVFLLAAFVLARRAQQPAATVALRTAVAAFAFAAIALPYVAALSAQKGRATFGDVGRIAYAELVDGATRSVHWQGQPAGTGTPVHPTRPIFHDPAMYEFALPVGGSYPPWYDPSYWYEGIRAHFSVTGQAKALLRSANMYLKLFSRSGALWVSFLLLLIFRGNLRWGRFEKGAWWVIAPSFAALAMYSLVLVEFRYVAPFVLILMIWLIAKLRLPERATQRDLLRVRVALLAAPAVTLAFGVARDRVWTMHEHLDENWAVAQYLDGAGLGGAKLGYIGTGLDAYWAHLAGARIVAELPEGEVSRFAGADSARKREALERFRESGAEALLTRSAAAKAAGEGWEAIAGTRYFVLKLRPGR